MPGDVIFVPTIGPLAAVAGEVLRPAIYEMSGPMTVRELIDLAGGLRPTAFTDLIQIERIEAARRVTYDLSMSEASDWKLQSGDLVKVYSVRARDELAVFLDGNVVRPGKRQFFEGMRLLDLVPSTQDLLPETYFSYGLIERESEVNRESEYLAFDLGAALLDSVRGGERHARGAGPRLRVSPGALPRRPQGERARRGEVAGTLRVQEGHARPRSRARGGRTHARRLVR